MDTSRRAVESYWRSRMIDGVTADEDKVAPVYKLEEICELLRTSHASIVKEVSEFILKRLDHKSPIVKQKTLRLIKYSVGKSGAEFRREMQRHSAAVRQLLHYKGNLDPLKGDALNKAVRDTAQETIAALFASDDNKAAVQVENINKRIEGFGNTNYEVPTEEKKSFLSEVVGLGSASIIQGLTSLAATHSLKKTDSGTYKSPNLRRSLTTEMDSRDRYEPVDEHYGDKWQSYGSSKNATPVSWNPDSRNSLSTSVNEDNSSNHVMTRSREERLLETIVTSGGVRLQPTRDALQAFLSEASKLDPLAMSRAIEMKLQSHLWQVRMKAICVLESILRKKDDDCFSIIESYFSENNDTVVKCCELPQASLRDKANKVFSLLSGSQNSSAGTEDPIDGTLKSAPAIQMPDLIDTFDPDNDDESVVNHAIEDLTSAPLVDDLFGDAPPIPDGKSETEDDPFAGVSFHVSDEKRHSDIFSGLTIDDRKSDQNALGGNRPELDLFGSDSWHAHADNGSDKTKNAQDLMAGFDLSGMNQGNSYGSVQIEGNNSSQHGLQIPSNGALKDDAFNSSNSYYPMPGMMMQYGMQPNLLFNPVLMGAYIAQQQQQQLLYQSMGSFNPGYINAATDSGGHSSALPDIFQISGNAAAPNLNSPLVMASSKKDETKAFDFISEHMSAARDSKRIL